MLGAEACDGQKQPTATVTMTVAFAANCTGRAAIQLLLSNPRRGRDHVTMEATTTPARQFLYETVAEDVWQMVEGGTLVAGERLPSVRELSRQRRLSISTVVQAYRLLEDRGLIEARPKSGHYVRTTRPSSEEPSITSPPRLPREVDVHALVSRIIDDRDRCHRAQLSAAVPHPGALPVRSMQRIVSSLVRRERPEWIAGYSFPPGLEALRRQIALYMRDWGVRATADDLIVTNGCMEALNLALRAVAGPGDVIVLESPTYFGLLQIIESLGMKALEVATHPRHGISLEALELALERPRVKACVLMTTVSNPVGSTMPDGAKKRLVRMLAKRDVALIEDAVFSALHFDPVAPYAAKAYDRNGNVMLCSSFSKTFSPGLRIGWIVPGRHYEKVQTLKFVNSIGVPELLQAAVAEFLGSGSYHRWLRRLRSTYAEQLRRFSDGVKKYFPEGTRVSRPSGGYVLWIVMPENVDSNALYREALKEGIGICPGAMFSTSGRSRHCIRINCGVPWSPEIESSVARLGQLARHLAAG